MKWVSLICASSLALFAQAIEVSSKSASPGDHVAVVISIGSVKGSDVLGLQWETTFPAKQLNIEGSGPAVSDAAKSAGKSLTCAGKAAKDPEFYAYTCILIGGQREISSGPIAIFNFRISAKAQSGVFPVRVRHAEAVTKDLRKISLQDTEGSVMAKR